MAVTMDAYGYTEAGSGLNPLVPACAGELSSITELTGPAEITNVNTPSYWAHPHLHALRAPLGTMSNATSECLSARSAKVPADEPDGYSLGGACDNRKKPQLLPTVCELKTRAACMFTNRPSGVVGSGDDAVPMDATFELVLLAQQAVHELWEQRRADICCSPARADLQLDKEEGIGYLIGDILCGSLLPDEARAIEKECRKTRHKGQGRAGEHEGKGESEALQGAISGCKGCESRRWT